MPKFLTTTGVSSEIENIIKGSKNNLALISPYLKLSQNFFERLRDADRRNTTIWIVYGKEELNLDQKKQLSSLSNLKLFFCKNLHAKCYMNESACVITSMNMYDFSEKNNREMGVLFSKADDQEVFGETVQEIRSIIQNSTESDILTIHDSEFTDLPPVMNESKTSYKRTETMIRAIQSQNKKPFASSFFNSILNVASNLMRSDGFCLRCGSKVEYDPAKPFCFNCYQQWAIYGNPEYLEKHCHSCGKKHKTSLMKPICRGCYNS